MAAITRQRHAWSRRSPYPRRPNPSEAGVVSSTRLAGVTAAYLARSERSQPNSDRLRRSLLRPLVDLLIGQCAERVIDYYRGEFRHAERSTLHLRLVHKFSGYHNRGGATGGFELDGVMRTARRARPSVANRRQYDVVIGRNRLDQRRIGVFGETLFAIVLHGRKREFVLQPRDSLAQQAIGIPLGIVEYAQTQAVHIGDTWGKGKRRSLDDATGDRRRSDPARCSLAGLLSSW